MKNIGFVGLGKMGLPMTKRLINSGYSIIGYDINNDRLKEAEKLGAKTITALPKMGQIVDVIITMLPNQFITKDVILGPNGIVKGVRKGLIVIDMSTSAPIITKEIHDALYEKKVKMIDAPVSGGVDAAESGKLAIMVGGEKEVYSKVYPILESLGNSIYHVGPVSSGHTIKIINNMLFSIVMAATAEALVFGCKAGIDPKVFTDIINVSSGRSYATDVKLSKFVLPRNFEPGFTVSYQIKDMDIAIRLAETLGVPLLLTQIVRQIYQMNVVRGRKDEDTSSVVKLFEELMGLPEVRTVIDKA